MQVYWLERDEASFGRFMPLLEGREGTLGGRLSVELIIRPLAPDGANGEAAPRTAPVGKLVSVRAVDWDQELVRVREQDLEGATLFFCGPRACPSSWHGAPAWLDSTSARRASDALVERRPM